MKNIITGIALFAVIAMNAQIDRTTEPNIGPVPEINFGSSQSFELGNGLKVIVVENHKLPRVSFTLTIDNPPFIEGEKAGVGSLMGSLLGKGSVNVEKDAFYEEVDFMGASLSFNSSGGGARGLSKYSDRLLELLADAALNPNFTEEEFVKERDILLDGLKSNEKSVSSVARRVDAALAYGLNHPYGEFVSQETVNNVVLANITSHYRDYFVPKNAYLIVVGDVEFSIIKDKITDLFESWQKASPPVFTLSVPKNAQYSQINFVDMPNAVQSEIAVQNLVDLKMTDQDYFSALLANKVLGGSFRSYLNGSLREDKGYTYGAGSRIGADKYASRFRASASVRNVVTDSAVVVFIEQLNRIRNEKVDSEELEIAKAEYVGEFVMALERPETISRFALNILTEDLPQDFYRTYLDKINAVTVDELQATAQKLISTNNAKIVVTGKGSEVLDNLEKMKIDGKKIPIKYFDKFAASTEKPNYQAALPEGVTARTVLEKYIEAIGGKEKLMGVESYSLVAEAEMQGMKLNLEVKKTSRDQFMQDVKVMGNSMSKQVVDGDKGYMVIQGQRKDLGEDELKKVKEESAPFPELNLLNTDVTLEGVEVINDKKAYKIIITDEKTSFYDVETGLKIQDVVQVEAQGQQINTTFDYNDYQEVSGIKFPFLLIQTMGPQKFDFVVKELKINEGVSDVDFE
ncbi:M16 family metallopeptidase [Maribacter sp. HTCC2170]|uniref:M16 family metallopeptidase n=1 Tax=Maribacter sp. (strain HTCC2170 / KCCM 42371) TaxID=313603 RepID=UPI00006B3ADB|nr:pitrilysin family protein [Maribacter sp. HTCC2170]EAQ99784.1 putative metallopeptidase, M16 family protein [Maribacter sp. HTCC2170]